MSLVQAWNGQPNGLAVLIGSMQLLWQDQAKALTMTLERQARGKLGENLAVEHLEKLDWVIQEKNWRCRAGELDLIARDGETIVFLEVRTRRQGARVTPFQSVGFAKQKRVARAALYYVREQKLRARMRFDVIGIVVTPEGPPQLQHIRGAFQLPREYC